MKNIILFIVFVFSLQLFSQQKHQRKHDLETDPLEKLIYTHMLILPVDSISVVHFLYKVSHQNIVFLKNGGDYNAGIRIAIEVTDTNSNFVTREIKDWKIDVSSFEQTTSSGIFAEGLVSLKLLEGTYYILPILTDLNSNHEYKLKKQMLRVKSDKNFEPLIVDAKKINCDDHEVFRLTNYEDNIPFGPSDKNIIIPVTDLSLTELNLKVVSIDDTVAEIKLDRYDESSIGLKECSGKIVISKGDGIKTKNFILNDITGKLSEGPFTLIINDDKERKFLSWVFWYNKPKSLNFPELAIKAVKHIDKETLIDSLLDIEDELQYKALVDYWKKMDPSPETEYNELMAEYYTRVDYVQKNFSTIRGTEGIDTDRGEIYIKFGKPDQIERASNEKGKVVETWIYKKSQRKFVFVDKQGVGEFSLESS